jgi:hypothetical protein
MRIRVNISGKPSYSNIILLVVNIDRFWSIHKSIWLYNLFDRLYYFLTNEIKDRSLFINVVVVYQRQYNIFSFILKNVCCVACLSVDIHKQHSDQVKSVVDVANGEKTILSEHLEKTQKLEAAFADEHIQLQQMLESKNKRLLIYDLFFVILF